MSHQNGNICSVGTHFQMEKYLKQKCPKIATLILSFHLVKHHIYFLKKNSKVWFKKKFPYYI